MRKTGNQEGISREDPFSLRYDAAGRKAKASIHDPVLMRASPEIYLTFWASLKSDGLTPFTSTG